MLIQNQYRYSIFFANLDRARQTAMYFIIEEVEENVLDFSQGTEGLL